MTNEPKVLIRCLLLCAVGFFPWLSSSFAQTSCLPSWQPTNEAERLEWQREVDEWERYLSRLPAYLALLPAEPEPQLLMPVAGVRVDEVTDTWGAPRGGGRIHAGQDIFAPRGTPIYAATPGFVWRISERRLGGKTVTVVGGGGLRYYYAHLERYADGLQEGQRVTTDTLLGYVGSSGNAKSTPPHLHLGVSSGNPLACERAVYDPLPRLADRE